MTWPTVELGQVISFHIDAVEVDPSTTYDMAGVYSFGRGLFTRGPLSGAETTYKRFHRLSKGLIVLSQLKAWEGAVAIVKGDHDGMYLSTQFPTFTCDASKVHEQYVGWYLRHQAVWRRLRSLARGMGARRDTVSPESFLSVPILLPPLDHQRRIAARLDRVAKLVEARQQALEEINGDVDALLLKAFKHATEGAEYLPMEQVAPLVRRPVELQPDESYPELGVRSFGRGTFHKPDLDGMLVGSKRLFSIEPRDLVFNIVFAWEGAVAVAQAEDAGRVGSHRFLTCVPDPKLASVNFLLYYFLTREGIDKLAKASPGGAGRNRTLGLRKLEAIEVPVPTLDRQLWFDGLQSKLRNLRQTREETACDLDALVPSMLREVFGDMVDKQSTGLEKVETLAPMHRAAG